MSTNKKEETIELHNGFFWGCNTCGKENFERALVPSLTEDDIEYIKIQHKVNTAAHTLFIMPLEVTCKECGAQFKSLLPTLS